MPAKRKSQRGRGRPTKLTPQVHRRVVKLLRAGAFLDHVADDIGIDESTLRDWVRRGLSEPGSIFEEFSLAVRRATSAAEIDALGTLANAAKGDWKAVEPFLRMRNPRRYAPNVRLAVEEAERGILEALREGLDEETYARIIGVLARRSDGVARAPAA
jgi:transposase-like protein